MASEAVKVPFVEAAAPSTPAASRVVVYAKADGLMYSKDDAGVETLMSGGAGGGSVATDAIWDAKGDLAGGTGANTAAKLTVGSNGTVLMAASGETTGLKWVVPTSASYSRTAGDYGSLTSASFADVDSTNLSLTITTGARRVMIAVAARGSMDAVNRALYLDVDLDGSRLGGTDGVVVNQAYTAGAILNMSFTYITDALSAASHTFKLQYKVSTGTGTLMGNSSNTPLRFAVVELLT
jgi:hypothetical protein